MKLKKFLAFALMAATALNFTACSDDDDDDVDPKNEEQTNEPKDDDNTDKPNSDSDITITLDQTSLTLEAGSEAIMLHATVSPEGTTVTWSSSNAEVASVTSGVVVPINAGTATITATAGTATAKCEVTVTAKATPPSNEDHKAILLSGSEYYIMIMGATAVEELGSKVKYSFAPNDVNKIMYWWNGGSAGTCSGLNAFNYSDGWEYMISGSGWCANGLFIKQIETEGEYEYASKMSETINADIENYYFGYSVKRTKAATDQKINFVTANDKNNGGEKLYEIKLDNVPADGEWHSYTIKIADTSAEFGKFDVDPGEDGVVGINILTYNVGEGQELQIDNVCIFKK